MSIGKSIINNRLVEGGVVKRLNLESIRSTRVSIPDSGALVHLQFRRFAGCPICDLHLHSFAQRHQELAGASIREVVVFHSSAQELIPFCVALPFDVIADPDKKLYVHFGVGSSLGALFSPSVWSPILRGVLRSLRKTIRGEAPLPSLNPHGGRFGLPADFLISPNGVVVACKYGSHAFDQWTVDEILALAHSAQSELISAPHRVSATKVGAL